MNGLQHSVSRVLAHPALSLIVILALWFTPSFFDRGTVQLSMRGRFGAPGRDNAVLPETSWDCDPGLLRAGVWHHVVANVDGPAKLVMFVVDGQLCDGGAARPYGWARLPRELRTIPTTKSLRLAPSLRGELDLVRIYNRRLFVHEAVGDWRAGRPTAPKPPSP